MTRTGERQGNVPHRRLHWRWVAVGVVVAVVVVLLGPLIASQVSALSYAGVRTALQARGASVQDQGPSGPDAFLVGTDHELLVNGARVGVYEYPTAFQANLDAASISSDGTTFSRDLGPFGHTAITVDYIAPPHWFHAGRVIVFYDGCDAHLVGLLTQVVGPPFAGANNWQATCAALPSVG